MIALVALLAARSLSAAAPDMGAVVQVHFAGSRAVSADPNSAGLKYLWNSPEATTLLNQTENKLARSLDLWLRQKVAPGLTGAVALRPLLDDMCVSEWQLVVREPSTGTIDFNLSVRLDNARVQEWEAVLKPVVDGWRGSSPAHQGGLSRNGGWLVLELGADATPPAETVSPLNNTWLTAYFNWTRLAGWFPGLKAFDLPNTSLQVVGQNGNFVVDGRFHLAQPLPKLANWQVPASTIHGPVISFAAARGISDWLQQQPWVAAMGLAELPDQIFTWEEPQSPFMLYAAAPLPSATSAVPKAGRAVSDALAASTNTAYRNFKITTGNNQISLTGLPLVAPYLKVQTEPAGTFLLSGFFPNLPRGAAVRPDLLSRLNDAGLVYYQWEDTATRLRVFPQLYQLLLVVTRHRQVDPGSAAGKWLDTIKPRLGSAVTAAYEVTPRELSFSRKAPAGLTALELIGLVSWLEAPNFPGCDLRLPPVKRPAHIPGRPAGAGPGKPVPFQH